MDGTRSLRAVRRCHETVILRLLRERPMSRAELVTTSGLSRSTVVAVITQLLDSEVVVTEREPQATPRRGRPTQRLRLNPMGVVWLAVDVVPGYLRAVIANAADEVVCELDLPTDLNADAEHLASGLDQLLDRLTPPSDRDWAGLRGWPWGRSVPVRL